jgi:hypothetical protein
MVLLPAACCSNLGAVSALIDMKSRKLNRRLRAHSDGAPGDPTRSLALFGSNG